MALALPQPRSITAIDFSAAQNALLELKLAALRNLGWYDYVAFLGARPSFDRVSVYRDRLRKDLRDEVHRFVINAHRGKRTRAIATSELDRIAGIGGKRKKALLSHFGSVRDIQGASLHDLERIPGVNKAVARSIYDHFHEQG